MDTETTTPDVSAESSPAQPVDVKPATEPSSLKDFVRAELGKSTPEKPTLEAPAADESAASEVEKDDQPQKTDESPAVESEELKLDETKPIPYNRFKEVNTQKNEAVAKVKELEPKLQQYEATFNDPNVRAALDVLNLITTNPAKALEQLAPIVEHLKQIKGDALPQDLADAVAEGVMDPKYAKELSMLRLQQAAASRQLEQQQKTAQEQAQNTITSAWATWDQEHRKTDPDFQQGSPKWKLVNELLTAKVATSGFPTSQAQAIELAEAAYAEVNGYLKPTIKPTRKTLSSTNSSPTTNEPDPTKMDLKAYVQARLARKS